MSEFETTKDLVLELLEKNGTIDALKAELRASVFLALQSTQEFKNCRPARSRQDTDIAFLVRDFLKFAGLPQTAAVLAAEWGHVIDGSESIRKIPNSDSEPLIATLLKSFGSAGTKDNTLSPSKLPSLLAPLPREVPSKQISTSPTSPTPESSPFDFPSSKFTVDSEPSSTTVQAPTSALPSPNSQDMKSNLTTVTSSAKSQLEPVKIADSTISRLETSDLAKKVTRDHVDTPLTKTSELFSATDEGEKAKKPRVRSSQLESSQDPPTSLTLKQEEQLEIASVSKPAFDSAKPVTTEIPGRNKEAVGEEESEEQHSSDRSASKGQDGVDYFEPVL